ncbi:MAG: class I SAM-dependent methyltransferase [Patescibacteria group bacterium]|nr:class I SAM-dependent methyltransferase [Patescibacteria group bacterium]
MQKLRASKQRFEYDKKYFDKHYSTSFYRSYVSMRNSVIHKEVSKNIETGRLLEVGFGDDNLLRFFKDDFEVYGIDIAEYALESLPKSYNLEHFTVLDVSKDEIPFSVKFDVIVMVNTLEHLDDPEFAIKNVYKVLNDGGIMVQYLPTQSNAFSKLQYRKFYDVEEHIYRPSVSDLQSLFQEAGFERVRELCANFFPIRIPLRPIIESFNLYFGIWRK